MYFISSKVHLNVPKVPVEVVLSKAGDAILPSSRQRNYTKQQNRGNTLRYRVSSCKARAMFYTDHVHEPDPLVLRLVSTPNVRMNGACLATHM